jgi:hypothetical protein
MVTTDHDIQGKIYIHAGCPTSGRLATLHSFDIAHRKWSALAPAPGPGRGGTALAVVSLPDEEHPVILRFAGIVPNHRHASSFIKQLPPRLCRIRIRRR